MALFSRNLISSLIDRIAALTEDIFIVSAQGTSFYNRITITNDPDLEIGGTPPGLEAANAVDTKLSSDTILDTEFTEILQWVDTVVTTVPPTTGETAFTSFDQYLTTNGFRVHETFKNIFNRQVTNQITAVNAFPREVLLGTISFTSSSAISFTDGSAVNTNNVSQTAVGALIEVPLVETGLEIRLEMADGLSGQTTERLVVDAIINPPLDTDDLIAISSSGTYQELSFTSCIPLAGNDITAASLVLTLVANAGATLSPPLSAQELNVLNSDNNPLFLIGDRLIIKDNTSSPPFEVHTVANYAFNTPTLVLTLDRPIVSTFLNADAPLIIRADASEAQDPLIAAIGLSGPAAFTDDVLVNSLNIVLNASTVGALSGKLPEINTLADNGSILFKPNMKVLIRDDTDVVGNINQEINCILSATIINSPANDKVRLTLIHATKNEYTIANNVSIQRLYTDIATVQTSATGVAGYQARFINVQDREIVS